MKLQDFLDKRPDLSLLEIKLLLIRKKKEGSFFYFEEMSSLPMDQPFVIYNSLMKLKCQKDDTFPVSCSFLKSFPTIDELKVIFKEYHQTEESDLNIDFSTFSIFKGEKWIWYWDTRQKNKVT